MADFAHSQRANNARIIKADALSRFMLDAAGAWPDTEQDRRKVERLAGVRPSSAETWDMARSFYDDLVASRDRASA